jgi:hypothetical protein
LRSFVDSQKINDYDESDSKLIWLYVPDYTKLGMFSEILNA